MKYSKEIINEICHHIENGHTQKSAAALAGVSETQFYKWRKEKAEFSESLRLAHAKYKKKLIDLLHGAVAAKKDARTALEILARRYPDEWGEKRKYETIINPQEEMNKLMKRIKEDVESGA